jgi:phosphoribosylformylglycinamidine synthase
MAVQVLENHGLPYHILGQVGDTKLTILMPKERLEWRVAALQRAWAAPLREVLP